MRRASCSAKGGCKGNAIVATVMSNIGLELALRALGIDLVRTAVGDKYVMEEMLKRGLSLGGEQSGHIIFSDYLFTGEACARRSTCCGRSRCPDARWPTSHRI